MSTNQSHARRALAYCRHDVSCERTKQSHESRLFFDKPCTCGLLDLWKEIDDAEKSQMSSAIKEA